MNEQHGDLARLVRLQELDARAALDHLQMELAAFAEALVVEQHELLSGDVVPAELAALDDATLHAYVMPVDEAGIIARDTAHCLGA